MGAPGSALLLHGMIAAVRSCSPGAGCRISPCGQRHKNHGDSRCSGCFLIRQGVESPGSFGSGWMAAGLLKYGIVLLIVVLSSHLHTLLLTMQARHDYVQHSAIFGGKGIPLSGPPIPTAPLNNNKRGDVEKLRGVGAQGNVGPTMRGLLRLRARMDSLSHSCRSSVLGHTPAEHGRDTGTNDD